MLAAEETYDEFPRIDDLQRQKSRLEQRLEDGFIRIGEAERLGRDVGAWEQFWFTLLYEYETICNELADAA